MSLRERSQLLATQWSDRCVELDKLAENASGMALARIIGKVSTTRSMMIELERELKEDEE